MRSFCTALVCVALLAPWARAQGQGQGQDSPSRSQEAAFAAAYNVCLADCQANLVKRSHGQNDQDAAQQYNTASKLLRAVAQQAQPSWARQAIEYQKAIAQIAFPREGGNGGGTPEQIGRENYLRAIDVNQTVQEAVNAAITQRAISGRSGQGQQSEQTRQQTQQQAQELVQQLVDTSAQQLQQLRNDIQGAGGQGQQQLSQMTQAAEQLVTQLRSQIQNQGQQGQQSRQSQ